jgi:hypothetical protein
MEIIDPSSMNPAPRNFRLVVQLASGHVPAHVVMIDIIQQASRNFRPVVKAVSWHELTPNCNSYLEYLNQSIYNILNIMLHQVSIED